MGKLDPNHEIVRALQAIKEDKLSGKRRGLNARNPARGDEALRQRDELLGDDSGSDDDDAVAAAMERPQGSLRHFGGNGSPHGGLLSAAGAPHYGHGGDGGGLRRLGGAGELRPGGGACGGGACGGRRTRAW